MRLIDLDTLKVNLCGDCAMNFPKECRQIGCTRVDKQDILEALRIPVIDAVPVIRCKDCKYWLPHSQFGFDEDNEEYHDYCELLVPDDDYYAITRKAEDFCSRAEREEE